MTQQAAQALVAGVNGKNPEIDPSAFTAPTSVVVGDVRLGAGASIWYSAVLRADCGPITLGADSNVQDNCTVHVDPGFPVSIGERVSIGHNAVVHGCTVEDDCLIGMGATVLNGAVIGAGFAGGGPGPGPAGHDRPARLAGRRMSRRRSGAS